MREEMKTLNKIKQFLSLRRQLDMRMVETPKQMEALFEV